MSRQNQMIVLGVLVLILGVTIYSYVRPSGSGETRTVASWEGRFIPLKVDNPALRMDILKRFLTLEYKGVHRNIFTDTLPPPPQTEASKKPAFVPPPAPTGPPPLTVDAKYFGYVSDRGGAHRRAFFATPNNEDVFIAGEGDTLMGRFRVDKITPTSADVEEVSSGRHTTLTLEEPGPNG